eukprot:NODE_142_length_2637_cov_6.666151_g115_i0.p1 GENE.NODE_142_length_2637_cov_6.666151_g115_i0~~NODE_142_length_2637_cov_6.666151_g115_i0.p1  ORF type:complete len:806 (+),score=285.78 NODE_142_length_2637_cov_6.666151_g115_i0:94-2511(+)
MEAKLETTLRQVELSSSREKALRNQLNAVEQELEDLREEKGRSDRTKNERIADLERQLRELEGQQGDLKHFGDQASQREKALRHEVSTLQADLDAARADRTRAEKSSAAKLADLERQLREAEQAQEDLKFHAEQASHKEKAARAQIAELERELEEVRAERARLEKQLGGTERQLRENEEETRLSLGRLSDQSSNRERALRQDLSALEIELDAARDDRHRMERAHEDRVRSLEAELEDLRAKGARCDDILAELQEVRSVLAAQTAATEAAELRAEEMAQAYARLRDQMRDFDSERAAKDRDLDALRTANSDLLGQLERLRAQAAERVGELDEEKLSLRRQLDEVQHQLGDAQRQLADAEERYASLYESHQSAATRCEDLEGDNLQLAQRLQEELLSRSSLQQEIAQLQARDQEVASLEDENRSLSSKLHQRDQEFGVVEAKLHRLEMEHGAIDHTLQDRLNSALNEVADLTTRLAQLEADLREKDRAADADRRRLRELEAENSSQERAVARLTGQESQLRADLIAKESELAALREKLAAASSDASISESLKNRLQELADEAEQKRRALLQKEMDLGALQSRNAGLEAELEELRTTTTTRVVTASGEANKARADLIRNIYQLVDLINKTHRRLKRMVKAKGYQMAANASPDLARDLHECLQLGEQMQSKHQHIVSNYFTDIEKLHVGTSGGLYPTSNPTNRPYTNLNTKVGTMEVTETTTVVESPSRSMHRRGSTSAASSAAASPVSIPPSLAGPAQFHPHVGASPVGRNSTSPLRGLSSAAESYVLSSSPTRLPATVSSSPPRRTH